MKEIASIYFYLFSFYFILGVLIGFYYKFKGKVGKDNFVSTYSMCYFIMVNVIIFSFTFYGKANGDSSSFDLIYDIIFTLIFFFAAGIIPLFFGWLIPLIIFRIFASKNRKWVNFRGLIKILLVMWLTSPVTMTLTFIWFLSNELSFVSILATIVYTLPFFILTVIYFYLLVKRKLESFILRVVSFIIPVLVSVYFVINNFISYRISLGPNQNDSPFDQWWYFAPQTAYGYPSPYYRIIDAGIKNSPEIIFDINSIVLNIFYFIGALFFITLIQLILFRQYKVAQIENNS
ncbi:MAG: hypothetical protein COA79_22680 [Planctomycetota bacterium]|nr:MAG: hypothetical protein COA79_22680 [Planctomycetota bacterium]